MAEARREVNVKLYGPKDWPAIAPVWARLADADPCSSFYLTEAWVGAWLEVFGSSLDPAIVLFQDEDDPVGACLLVRTKHRRAMLPVTSVYVNTAGEPAAESTYIEYNDLICREGWNLPVAESLAQLLAAMEWDQIVLPGFQRGPAYEAICGALSDFDLQEDWRPSRQVDMAGLRLSGTSYEKMLSPNVRAQVRRKTKAYLTQGPLRLEKAADIETAFAMFDSMIELIRLRWRERSVASSPRFVAFHRSLIRRCFPSGGIQFLRLSAGDSTIGYLYNFVHRGKVYAYQGGFNYPANNAFSPGLVTYAQAIQFCIAEGLDCFDFLAGKERYKQSLSTTSDHLTWSVVRKDSLKLRMLQRLARFKRRVTQAA